uniref:Uncharacterized protein n=1 Tax=Lepeophtheirus salmonis TaxID=72036 RepID=A0A0K2VER2_LEPSM
MGPILNITLSIISSEISSDPTSPSIISKGTACSLTYPTVSYSASNPLLPETDGLIHIIAPSSSSKGTTS